MNTRKLRIGFMGTPDFAVPALRSIVEAGHEVVCVYTQPPRPKGRGHKVQISPVHKAAEDFHIPVFHPKSLKTPDAQQEFAAHNLDVAVVAAYGLLLPVAVLEAPLYGCLNIHASLLPRWRGAAPIQYAIWKGDQESGVTIMQMDKGLDTGAMIAKSQTSITHSTTASALHDILSAQGSDLIINVLEQIGALEEGQNRLIAEAQNEELSTYASLLKKEDGLVNWSQNAAEIDQQIRALNPWPGVWTCAAKTRMKILSVQHITEINDMSDHKTGEILDKKGHVLCGAGTVLRLISIQPEGKKPMDFASALNGGYLEVGQVFS